MRGTFVIAKNTVKENIRNKVLYNILLFAAIIIFLSTSFGKWSVLARTQVILDFGLATMSLSGLLMAIFIGVSLLANEINSKTIYLMVAKPIDRSAILIGKYLGLCFTILINFLIMVLFFIAAVKFSGGEIDPKIIYAIILTTVEMWLIVSASLMFSVITNPTMSAILTIAFYAIGHLNNLFGIETVKNPFLKSALKIIYSIFPNLENFNIRVPVVFGLNVDFNYFFLSFIYGLLYITLLLFIAVLIFSHKDL